MFLNILETIDKNTKTQYIYNSNHHLEQILLSEQNIQFTFDENERRKSKIINEKIVEKYLWQGDEKLHIVTDENDTVLREYLYKTKYDYLPYGMKFDNQIYYFIYNKMNTLRIVLNQQKQVVKILKYDNNGKIVGDTNKKLKVDFSYAGGLLEPLSGLLFFEEGVFNPKRGKWISQIENDDIIENLKKLSQLPSTDVYECSDTLDTYYHSYLCTNGRCGGFYAINYMSYLDGLGTMSDNSKYFHLKRCNKVNISTNLFNTKKFSQCIENEIQSKEIQRFDFLTDNCHHKVSEILNQCKSVSQKEEM